MFPAHPDTEWLQHSEHENDRVQISFTGSSNSVLYVANFGVILQA